MKKFIVATLTLALATVAVSTPALAFEGSGDAYIGIYSKYLWRGFDVNADDDYVFQGGSDVSFGDFSVGWWANANEDMDVDEVDIVLDYAFAPNDMLAINVGNILYEIGGANTNELYLSLGLNTILEPNFTIYYDYDAAAGDIYYTASVGHGIDVNDMVSVSAGVLIGYWDADKALGYSEFQNADLSVGADLAVNENVSLSASALYTLPLSDEAEDEVDHDGEATVGLSVTLAF